MVSAGSATIPGQQNKTTTVGSVKTTTAGAAAGSTTQQQAPPTTTAAAAHTTIVPAGPTTSSLSQTPSTSKTTTATSTPIFLRSENVGAGKAISEGLDGGPIVFGYNIDGSSSKHIVRKYGPDLSSQWVLYCNGSDNGADFITSAFQDPTTGLVIYGGLASSQYLNCSDGTSFAIDPASNSKFIIALNGNTGTVAWYKVLGIGGSSSDSMGVLFQPIPNTNQMLVVGMGNGNLDFGDGVTLCTTAGRLWQARLYTNGTAISAATMSTSTFSYIGGLAVGSDGRYAVCVNFGVSSVTVGSSTFNQIGSKDSLILSFSSADVLQWGTQVSDTACSEQLWQATAMDGSFAVYSVVYRNGIGSVSVGNVGGSAQTLNMPVEGDSNTDHIVVTKHSATGSLVWAKSGTDMTASIVLDLQSNLFVLTSYYNDYIFYDNTFLWNTTGGIGYYNYVSASEPGRYHGKNDSLLAWLGS